MLCRSVLLLRLRMQQRNSSCLVTFLFCFTDVMIIIVYVSSPSRWSKVFVTVKPVLQGPLTVCLKSHIPLNVTGVLEIILRGGFGAISHLFLTGCWWESQLFPVFPPQGDVSLEGGGGQSNPKQSSRWHWQRAFDFILENKRWGCVRPLLCYLCSVVFSSDVYVFCLSDKGKKCCCFCPLNILIQIRYCLFSSVVHFLNIL